MEDALPGRPSPLGATPRDGGINFAATLINEDGWNDPEALALGVYLDGSDAPNTGPDGQPLLDDDFLVLVNGWWEPLEFTIPGCRPGLAWQAVIDTFDPAHPPAAAATAGRRPGRGRAPFGPGAARPAGFTQDSPTASVPALDI